MEPSPSSENRLASRRNLRCASSGFRWRVTATASPNESSSTTTSSCATAPARRSTSCGAQAACARCATRSRSPGRQVFGASERSRPMTPGAGSPPTMHGCCASPRWPQVSCGSTARPRRSSTSRSRGWKRRWLPGGSSWPTSPLAATIRKVEDSLRRLLTTVSPEALDLTVGLKEAIRDRLETLRVSTGIEPDVDLQFPDDLPSEVESVVFKNIAEALTNVERHSHATRIHVAASVMDGGVVVEVTDDGTGFVVHERMYVPGHLGLLAMKQRAQLVGGWCRVASEPGEGAKIEFWVPTA